MPNMSFSLVVLLDLIQNSDAFRDIRDIINSSLQNGKNVILYFAFHCEICNLTAAVYFEFIVSIVTGR